MAKDKKSVLLYCDLIHTIEKMDDETAGLFFKHYLRYINDLNPTTDNIVVDISFEAVKQNLKRDLKKWENRAERSRENGKKGGRPKNPTVTQKTQQVISEPKKPVTVNVTVTDTVKEKDILYIKNDLFNSNQWKESITRIYNCKLIEVEKYLTIFLDEQEIDGNLNRELKEIKTHFRSWFKLQPFKKNISNEPHIPRIAL